MWTIIYTICQGDRKSRQVLPPALSTSLTIVNESCVWKSSTHRRRSAGVRYEGRLNRRRPFPNWRKTSSKWFKRFRNGVQKSARTVRLSSLSVPVPVFFSYPLVVSFSPTDVETVTGSNNEYLRSFSTVSSPVSDGYKDCGSVQSSVSSVWEMRCYGDGGESWYSWVDVQGC